MGGFPKPCNYEYNGCLIKHSEQFEIYPRNILQFAECGRSQILTSIKDQTIIDRIVTNTSIPGSFVKFYDLDNG